MSIQVTNHHATPFPFRHPVSLGLHATSLRITPDRLRAGRVEVAPTDHPPLVNPFDFLIGDDTVTGSLAHPNALKGQSTPYLEATSEYPDTLSMRRPA